uniref:peptidylprolyl isomerase n=1 Tax=Megaselia scalaris TaxID=36166 RepID=T1GG85_MEGSC
MTCFLFISSDLLDQGTIFEIDANFVDNASAEFLSDFESEDEDNNPVDSQVLKSPWEASFDELRLLMTKVNNNIYKKVIVEGYDTKRFPSFACRVTVNYNGFFEKETTPFDSTYLRGKPFVFTVGQDDVLEGLNEAVQTMNIGEESQFVLSHRILFKEMGCPPRIPPKADGLFVIRLINFSEIGDENALMKAHATYLNAVDSFKGGRYTAAKNAFHKAVNALEFCNASNEDEDKKRNEMLLKLYRNLAVTYNKLDQPARACDMCKELKRLENYNQDCKGMFQEGKALAMLGDFKNAKKWLLKAQNLEPNNIEIYNEIKNVSNKEAKYKESQENFMKRAFGVLKNVTEEKNEELSLFKEEIKGALQEFKTNPGISKFSLPTSLNDKEIDVIRDLAEEMEMKLVLDPLYRSGMDGIADDLKKYYISKTE